MAKRNQGEAIMIKKPIGYVILPNGLVRGIFSNREDSTRSFLEDAETESDLIREIQDSYNLDDSGENSQYQPALEDEE